MRWVIAITALAIFLTGCAKAPEAVVPQYVSPLQYQHYDCDQLAEEISRNEIAIAEASQQQRRARNNDIIGVILIGLPVSSLSGSNVADYLGRLKGERDTLATVATEQRCGLNVMPADEIIEANTPVEQVEEEEYIVD